jgi:uncharacterized protein YjeT (DUF2065 family)
MWRHFPFLSPRVRRTLAAMLQLGDSQLRFAGMTSMLIGVVLCT